MSADELRPGVRRAAGLPIHRPDQASADADAELDSVLSEQIEYLKGRGREDAEAGTEALRAARGTLRGSAVRRERRLKLHDAVLDWVGDLRHAFRSLRRAPGLTIAAVLTLALAIGANTAIFSAVSAVLLRPLPFRDPGQLVMLWEKNPDFGWDHADAAPANYLDWKEQAGVFADAGAYPTFSGTAALVGYGDPQILRSQQSTGNLFTVLGVRAVLGRVFEDRETWSNGGPSTVLLEYHTWRDVFASDHSIIGRTIDLGGAPVEVVGVLPASFRLPGVNVDVWRPIGWSPANRSRAFFRRAHWLRVVARLNPGVTEARADAALQSVVKRLEQEYPETNTRMGAGLSPLHDFLVGGTRLPLLVMLGAVGLVLLIACANIGNLLLVRAAGRARETSLRVALGAGRGRLLRHTLAETALLALMGGLAGLGLGWGGIKVLAALQPAGMLPVTEVGITWPVLGFAALATVLAALLFGLAPTLWSLRRHPADVLREESRTSTGSRSARRWGDSLLVFQVAIALALTLGAGLLTRSYLRLQGVDPGFDYRQVLAVELVLPGTRYDSVRKVLSFYRELEQEARSLPGVEAAALVSGVPLGPPTWTSQFSVAGRPPQAKTSQVQHREISPGYQAVMGIALLRGRLLQPSDDADSPRAVLINAAFARVFFPGEDPIGLRISFDREPDSTSTWRTIVGVVADVHQRSLSEDVIPEVLAPLPQELRSGMTLVLRTSRAPGAVGPSVRRLIAKLDPLLAVSDMRTMSEVRSASLAKERFLMVLIGSFAAVGLVLGLIGTYGVMAQISRHRLREMGIRIALGARAAQVQWLVVRRGVLLALLGSIAGIVAALSSGGVIQSLLYGVRSGDLLTFLLLPLLVLLIAALASWLPAARASRADPTQVLRSD